MIIVLKNDYSKAVTFNNDVSYVSLAPLIYFIYKVQFYFDLSDMDDAKYMQFFQKMTAGIFDYLNGNKDKITDSKIYKAIDRAYYDCHPEDMVFYESESKYGIKEYRNTTNDDIVKFCSNENSESEYGSQFNYCTLVEGTTILDGVLVISVH